MTSSLSLLTEPSIIAFFAGTCAIFDALDTLDQRVNPAVAAYVVRSPGRSLPGM